MHGTARGVPATLGKLEEQRAPLAQHDIAQRSRLAQGSSVGVLNNQGQEQECMRAGEALPDTPIQPWQMVAAEAPQKQPTAWQRQRQQNQF